MTNYHVNYHYEFCIDKVIGFFNKPLLNFAEIPVVKAITKIFTIEKNTATNRGIGANPPPFSKVVMATINRQLSHERFKGLHKVP